MNTKSCSEVQNVIAQVDRGVRLHNTLHEDLNLLTRLQVPCDPEVQYDTAARKSYCILSLHSVSVK